MKINPTNNPQRYAPSELRDVNKPAGGVKGSASSGSARLQSSGAPDTSQDIDSARVAEIRQAISNGKLDIRVDKVADAIIASAHELAGKR